LLLPNITKGALGITDIIDLQTNILQLRPFKKGIWRDLLIDLEKLLGFSKFYIGHHKNLVFKNMINLG